MSRALHDAQRFGSCERLPGDAGRAQIVERDALRRGRVVVQFGAIDAGALQVLAENCAMALSASATAGSFRRDFALHDGERHADVAGDVAEARALCRGARYFSPAAIASSVRPSSSSTRTCAPALAAARVMSMTRAL